MQVIAIKTGFYTSLRAPGDEFEVPDDARGSWFHPVEPKDDARAAAKKPKELKAQAADKPDGSLA